MPRISLIHATPLAMQAVKNSFATLWPQAEVHNLLDETLSSDLELAGGLNRAMTQRILDLSHIAQTDGAQGILFTCSAFGSAIDEAKLKYQIPIFKPNEAMFNEALAFSATPTANKILRIGLLTTFAPAAASMRQELETMATEKKMVVEIFSACADQAMTLLNQGHAEKHDAMVKLCAQQMPVCDVYLLGQFSMAHLQTSLSSALNKPVLSSPSSAVAALKKLLDHSQMKK